MALEKAAILGATGPVGLHLGEALVRRGIAVRAVSRSMDRLRRMFSASATEHVVADVLKTDDVRRAVEGCDVVFQSVGFPGPEMHLHRVAANNVAEAVRATGIRCVHVSSYWAYMPLVGNPLNEDHPRQGGPAWVRDRRAAEDTLRGAGAAIANLPDFYGPHVHTSTLQQPLIEAAHGKTMHWIGSIDTEREYAFVPDAADIIVALAEHDAAYGEHWLIPTAGPLTGRRAAEIANEVVVTPVKVRGAGLTTLRALSLFNTSLRGLMQVAPDYVKPLRYETLKIERLLGPQSLTSYEDGIRRTIEWLRERAQ